MTSNALSIIRALHGNPHNGACLCPAHEDTTPSLKVSEQNGRILVHCHAGCPQENVIWALKQKGLWNGNSERTKPIAKPERQNSEIAAYEKRRQAISILRAASYDSGSSPAAYLKERGIDTLPECLKLLSMEKAEGLQKTIPGFKPFPAMVAPLIGETLQGVLVTYLTRAGTKNLRGKESRKSVRRIYGSAKGAYIQMGDIDPDEPPKRVIVAEGIETALSAAQLIGDAPSIAVPGGNFINIVPPPADELILAADNDKSGVGQRKAREAASLWAQNGRTVRIAVAPNPYKDWNDADRDLDADRGRLGDLLANADKVEPPDPSEAAEMVRPLGMEDFISLRFPPRQFLLKPWLTTTGLTMIDAAAGHGKTWLALSIAYAVASGRPLLEWPCERAGKVLYVDGELPGELLQTRLKLLGPPLPETSLRVVSHSQFEMRSALILDLGTQDGRALLDQYIETCDIDLIILDSVSTLVRSGTDNDVESWRAIQEWSLKHRARGRAVIYLHHHGRSGNPRGTSAREIVLDTRIKLVRDDTLSTENESALRLEFPKAREFYGNDAAPMIAFLSTRGGVVTWRRESVKDNTRERVAELRKQGWKQTDIAKELGLSKGRISQIVKDLQRAEAKGV
jgi:putative DNA primase/helicase